MNYSTFRSFQGTTKMRIIYWRVENMVGKSGLPRKKPHDKYQSAVHSHTWEKRWSGIRFTRTDFGHTYIYVWACNWGSVTVAGLCTRDTKRMPFNKIIPLVLASFSSFRSLVFLFLWGPPLQYTTPTSIMCGAAKPARLQYGGPAGHK